MPKLPLLELKDEEFTRTLNNPEYPIRKNLLRNLFDPNEKHIVKKFKSSVEALIATFELVMRKFQENMQ